MFYETADNKHGLPHDPFKMCVIPRPIGWVSTISADGIVNLAPYSFFNAIASNPPQVMFCGNGRPPDGVPGSIKDSPANCAATGEFVVNLATWDLKMAMSASSAAVPAHADEFALAGLEPLPSRLVRPPRVKGAPVHLECRYQQTVELPCSDPHSRNLMVIGEVIGIHIDEAYLTDGLLDPAKMKPIARLGYKDYAVVEKTFTMPRPKSSTRSAAS